MVASVFYQERIHADSSTSKFLKERKYSGQGTDRIGGSWSLNRAVDVVLEAGEMSFHHANIVHGSNPNRTASPRVGFAVRYIATAVKQTKCDHGVMWRGEKTSFTFTRYTINQLLLCKRAWS